jgi:predicted site-specific integrase-resolvase
MHAKAYGLLLPDTKAARYLPVSVHTLRSWRRHGHGPAFVRIGRKVFYDLNDIEQWISSRPRGGEVLDGGQA